MKRDTLTTANIICNEQRQISALIDAIKIATLPNDMLIHPGYFAQVKVSGREVEMRHKDTDIEVTLGDELLELTTTYKQKVVDLLVARFNVLEKDFGAL